MPVAKSKHAAFVASIMLAAILAFPACAFAGEATSLADTSIGGVPVEIGLGPREKASIAATISPANGRTVVLQKKTSGGSWKDLRTYALAEADSDTIVVSIPSKEWKGKKHTSWRIHAPETDSAKEASSEMLVYARNRKTLSIGASSAIVMNATTGRVLYDKAMNKRRPQASITKAMTAIVAIEKNSLSKTARISRKAQRTPWTYVPIAKNDKVKLQELLYAALLPSSNGSATALAEATAGSVKRFSKLMNSKAKELGMTNTHYANAHGLTAANHYSSAYDTALLMQYAYRNRTFRKVVGTKRHVFRTLGGKSYRLTSTNALLGTVRGMKGGKTGTTDAAGCCFAGIYEHKGQTYITVVLGSRYSSQRWTDTRALIGYIKKYGW